MTMNREAQRAQEVVDSPISSALLNAPVSDPVANAQMWVAWSLASIMWTWVGFSIAWWPIWAVVWWISAAWLGALIQKESKSNHFKALWAWMKGMGILSWAIWTWFAVAWLGSFLVYFTTAMWTYLWLNVLFHYLTGNKAEAQRIIRENAWGKPELEEISRKASELEDTINNMPSKSTASQALA